MGDRVFAPVWSWQVTAIIILAFSATVRGGEDALYPYGPAAGDTEIGHIGGRETLVALTTPLKYYGQSFNTAYILNDGMISFEPGVRYLELKWREGAPYPAIDRPFIAPFHYNGYVAVNPQLYPARTYYKLISRSGGSVLTSEDRDFMDRLDTYLMSASVALKSGFYAEFAFKVTWENVSSADSCSESQLQTPEGCPSNTFQVVLVGNNEHTFAIFNYYKMEIPFTEHQLAGLNGGHGRGWTDVVPCTGTCAKRSKLDPSRINSLASRVGSDVEGRYILVINDDVIIRGGCIPSGLKSVEMEVFPRQVGMFGGEMLAVSARCLQPGTKIYCRFGLNDQARSEGVMETTMRGRCPVPILTTRGQVFLEISTDNMAWKYKTQITVVLPSRLQLPIDLSDIQSAWYEISPNDLRLRWKRDLFSGNRYATVEVNLIGYREDAYSNDPVVVRRLAQLATGVLNTDEQHTIDPSQFSCTSECEEFEIGLVQLRVSDQYIDETTKYQSVNVGPVALGWYVKNAMTQRYGNDWAAAKCKAWNDEDRLSAGWLDHLLPCPCTLSQALADWGRWQPDVGCNMFTGSVCKYHIGAKHCVRSVHPSQDGSGNQCCYEQDGNLRYAADTYQGSTPDRSHDWGSVPYGAPDHVPSLSHWTHDVITFYYCCLWVEYRQCNYYMDRRATRDCKAYTPPHSATVYGDPHITTFDGKSYYFGGAGDFWILKSDSLNIQGRFEERENQYLQISSSQLAPTNLTSIVAWISGSDVVTVRKAPPGGPQNRKLDVLVGTQRRFFEDSSHMWQDYNRVSIVNNAGTAEQSEDKHHSNFTVLFAGGAAVQVAERQGLLHVIVILPPGIGQTQGLLGTLDQDAANDFTTPQGDVIPTNANEDTVYLDFSLKWNVTAAESEFHWPRTVEDTKAPLFGDPQTFPYVDESQKPEEAQVQSVCRQSQSCRRDYYATNDVIVARASKKTDINFAALQGSQKIVRSCGHLDIPMSVKTPTVYTEGSVVTVTGCRPDNSPVQSTGPLTYVCNATGSSSSTLQWSPQPDTNLCPPASENTSAEKATDVGMIIGIVVAAIVVVIVLVIVIVCIRRRKGGEGSSGSKPVPAKRTNVPTDVVIDPGTDESLLKHKGKERGVRMSDMQSRSNDAV